MPIKSSLGNCLTFRHSVIHFSPALETVSYMKKNDFFERGEAVGWKRFRAETFSRSYSGHVKHMKIFHFIQTTISHLQDPHSKSSEPDCLSPSLCDYDTVSQGRGVIFYVIPI